MCDSLEDLVSVEVAVGVVHLLEVVEVDEDDGESGGVDEGFSPVLLKLLVEGVPVGEAGEGVALGDECQLLVVTVEVVDDDVVAEMEEVVQALFAVEAVVCDDGNGGRCQGETKASELLVALQVGVQPEEDHIAEEHGRGGGQSVGEPQAHGGVGEENDGEDAELSVGRSYGTFVAFEVEMREAGERGDEGDAGFAKDFGRAEQHADVDGERERGDDAGANLDGAPELCGGSEMVDDEEEIEERDGDNPFQPETSTAPRGGITFYRAWPSVSWRVARR